MALGDGISRLFADVFGDLWENQWEILGRYLGCRCENQMSGIEWGDVQLLCLTITKADPTLRLFKDVTDYRLPIAKWNSHAGVLNFVDPKVNLSTVEQSMDR